MNNFVFLSSSCISHGLPCAEALIKADRQKLGQSVRDGQKGRPAGLDISAGCHPRTNTVLMNGSKFST